MSTTSRNILESPTQLKVVVRNIKDGESMLYIEEQRDQINTLSKQMSELIYTLNPSKNRRDNVNTLNRNTEYPKGVKDINNSEEDDIFHFL